MTIENTFKTTLKMICSILEMMFMTTEMTIDDFRDDD